MKKIFRLTIILLISFSALLGQDPYVPKYKFSKDILSRLFKGRHSSEIAWELSYIGEYKKVLEKWDKDDREPHALTQNQVKDFLKYKPVDAKDFIIQKAKTEQIIILNEAHQQPYHRVFTTSLLADLYKQGFRYFGAETISEWDSVLNKRKYPTLNSGYYTQEPCYGNLVREALRIGYTVFTYESTRIKTDSAGINLREVDQAMNIKKVLDKDPKAKILIHCGFDHLVETPYFSWGKAMAGRLTEYTGINPFTIDQIRMTERSSDKFENSYFKMTNLDYYAFFVDSTNKIFNGPETNKEYDARVYHPRTKWLNGRPHWMFENNREPFNVIEKITISFPCLVFAYLADENLEVKKESDKPIPFDLIELKDKSDNKALSLKKGKYNIIIQDKKGKEKKLNVTF